MGTRDERIQGVIEQADDLLLKRRALEETPFGITIADMRADDEPLIYVNEGFEEMTGYPREDVLGRNCRFLQGEETDEEPVQAMREAIENDDAVQVELRNYRRDGEQFWNEVTLSPLRGKSGEVTHYVGVQQEVTRRKEYEQQLEDQRDDLRVLNEMFRHDIRNDLQVALTSLELLQRQQPGEEQVQTALENIRQAIDLTNTARDVAEVMLDSGTERMPIEAGIVLETQIQNCRSSYPDADVSVAGTVPQVRVLANDLLESVFRNLLTNAVRHNDAATPEIVVAATTTDDELVVAIGDNGPGVPEDERPHLFERGFRGEGSSGSGIGLYVASKLVRGYGGTLSLSTDTAPTDAGADANLGGATFVVRLPLAD